MFILIKMGMRNIFRHKKRSVFLGLSIAISAAIFILADAFAGGVRSVIVNQVIGTVNGHVNIVFGKNGSMHQSVIPAGERIREIIGMPGPDILDIQEHISVMAKTVGKSRSDNVMLTGIIPDNGDDKGFSSNIKVVKGGLDRLFDGQASSPAVVSEDKAEFLGLCVGDEIPVKFYDVNMHYQAARLTVVGIFRPNNFFVGGHIFVPLDTLKRMMRYRPFDIGRLNIRVKKPLRNAVAIADSLHRALRPRVVAIDTRVDGGLSVSVLGVVNSAIEKEKTGGPLQVNTETRMAIAEGAGAISKPLAVRLGVTVGDTISLVYEMRGSEEIGIYRFPVGSTYEAFGTSEYTALISQSAFYELLWEQHPPKTSITRWENEQCAHAEEIFCREWKRLERCETEDEMRSQELRIMKKGEKSILIGVRSMYENAGAILLMTSLLHYVSVVIVAVLFILICVGLISTVQMEIRERTREIGMMRAVGMLRSEVVILLVVEKLFLAACAIAVAMVVSYLMIQILGMLRLDIEGPVSMILLDGRLFFMPNLQTAIWFLLSVVCYVLIATWLPARAAAKIKPAESIMHYE